MSEFTKSFKPTEEIFLCKWDDTLSLLNYTELKDQFDISNQLEEFNANWLEENGSWGLYGYDKEQKSYGWLEYLPNLITVIRKFQDSDPYMHLYAVKENMIIRRVN